eukprot:scaffold67056_cov18-Tisochrysis_lutea.AAC.4
MGDHHHADGEANSHACNALYLAMGGDHGADGKANRLQGTAQHLWGCVWVHARKLAVAEHAEAQTGAHTASTSPSLLR